MKTWRNHFTLRNSPASYLEFALTSNWDAKKEYQSREIAINHVESSYSGLSVLVYILGLKANLGSQSTWNPTIKKYGCSTSRIVLIVHHGSTAKNG